jgi:7,8-dihydropterin-6-yl-methyl-4-(beta-D-ribofuranosyl)aminobenzene 5'-phosphate synthase
MKAKLWLGCLVATSGLFLAGRAATSAPPLATKSDPNPAQITALYDAFGRSSNMQKDWGFSALIEYGGKRILFDTGNNADIFARNVKAKGIDLTKLDFVVVSHRHGDHTSGLNYLLSVNPSVKIYAPKENFGVFGAALPGTFYRRDESLPTEMRYFDGKPPETLHLGSPWPQGNFIWVTKTAEVAPGFHLILLKGSWGVDLDVMEISLAIDTPEGIVLVVGCSHPTIEKVVEAAKAAIDKPIHLVVGGLHLLPAKDEEIRRIAAALHDTWKVEWIAPAHCTGEPAFAILKQTFEDRYLYAGLGTVLILGPTVKSTAEAEQSHSQAMDDDDLRGYRMLLAHSDDGEVHVVAGATARSGSCNEKKL